MSGEIDRGSDPLPGLPLAGRRIVVTRPEEGSGTLTARLERLGAAVVEVPLVATVEPADGGEALRQAAARWVEGSYEWLVLTSPTGARRFVAALPGDGRRPTQRDRQTSGQVACIGPGTASVLTGIGIAVDLIPERHVAEGMLAAFPPCPPTGGSILFPRAAAGRDLLPDGLAARGWSVELIEAYRTVTLDLAETDRAQIAAADAILLTSSSAAQRLVDVLGPSPSLPPHVVCIGPITAETATRAGVRDVRAAEVHSLDGLVDTVVAVLAS